MYGHMHHEEKLKPLVDQAHNAALQEYEQKRTEQPGLKVPQYMTFWSAIAQELYAKETADMKKMVAEAVEEEVQQAKILKNGPLLEGDMEKKRLRRKA